MKHITLIASICIYSTVVCSQKFDLNQIEYIQLTDSTYLIEKIEFEYDTDGFAVDVSSFLVYNELTDKIILDSIKSQPFASGPFLFIQSEEYSSMREPCYFIHDGGLGTRISDIPIPVYTYYGIFEDEPEISYSFSYQTFGEDKSHIIFQNCEGRYGMIDKKGEILIPFKYDNLYLEKDVIIIRASRKDKSDILLFDGSKIE